jgi:tRNA(Ile)-lysidine synthase
VQVKTTPEYQDRFRQALDRLGVSDHDRLMLAVSGGPDSLALLMLATAWASDRICVATIDHRLRTESADEAAHVGNICKELGIVHMTLVPAQPIGGNIQSSARMARYSLLEDAAERHDYSLIATAHHADDQRETLLMRLARGSGVAGMAGIRARSGRIIRPLLDFKKSELEDICKQAEIEPIRDPSNDNADFDRVAMRQWLERSDPPLDQFASNRTASALSDSAFALDWMTERLAEQRLSREEKKIRLDGHDLPKEIQRRLLMLALQHIQPGIAPRGEAIERLLAELKEGKTSTIGDILCRGGEIWLFSPAPPRRNYG